jgi:hypothetical protein
MLGLSGRAVAFYAAFAYPIGLFCAIPYFDDRISLDAEQERRRLRHAVLLTVLSPLHVLFPLTAYGIIRDANRLAERPNENAAARQRLQLVAVGGIIVSVIAFVVIAGTIAQ